MTPAERLRLLGAPIRAPGNALELVGFLPFPFAPVAALEARTPVDPGVELVGWVNPYRATVYAITVGATVSVQALPGNMRRSYLVIQNKGPGNLFFNFGSSADAVLSLQLVPGQTYEVIGGEAGGAFVPRDSIYLLADLAGTTAALCEGVAVPTKPGRSG